MRLMPASNRSFTPRQGGHDGLGLRWLLPAAIVLPLLILGLMAWQSWRQAWAQAEAELARTADTAAEYGLRILNGHRLAALLVDRVLAARSDDEIRAEEAALHDQLRGLLPLLPLVQTTFVSDRDGMPLVSATTFPVPRVSIADREWVRELRREDAPAFHVSAVARGRIDQNLFFGVSIRRTATGNGLPLGTFDGVINVSVNPNHLTGGLRLAPTDPSVAISFIRADGEILARSEPFGDPLPALSPDGRFASRARAGIERDLYTGQSLSGQRPILVALRRIQGWPVYVSASRLHAAVIARWRDIVVQQLAVGLPVVLALAGLALLAVRSQRKLSDTNASLEQRVRERTAAVTEGAARLRTALSAARLGVWQRHLPSATGSWDQRAVEIYGGLRPEDTPDLAEWRDRVHPDDRAARLAAISAAIRPGGDDFYQTRFRFRRNDGGWNWIAISGAVVERDPQTGDAVRLAGVVEDETERRAAERHRDMLMAEVDHRAKNVLALVTSILRQTEVKDAASFAQTVHGRISALAQAHALLAKEQWRGTSLEQLLEGEFAQYRMGTAPDRVVLQGDPLMLPARMVQPLAMVIHELATNAAKYGALSDPDGRIAVRWSRRSGPGGPSLRLVWTETGGPRIEMAPGATSFGTAMIEGTVVSQLDGVLERDWQSTGLVCTILVPLDGAGDASEPRFGLRA